MAVARSSCGKADRCRLPLPQAVRRSGHIDRFQSGVSDEWHLVLGKSFEDITFGFVSWFHQSVVRFGSSFVSLRFKAVGSIGDLVGSDRIKNLLVEVHSESSVTFTQECNQRLECIQCLDYTFEADRSRFPIVFAGGLGDDRADQIVSQDVRPDFLPN